MIETTELFATAGTADRIDAGVGVVWWAVHPPGDFALTVVDYDIFEMPSINADWVGSLFARSAELVAKHKPQKPGCHLNVEHPGLINVCKCADEAYRDMSVVRGPNRNEYDIKPIKESQSKKWPLTLDERAYSIRPLVDSGKIIKVETGLRRFSFRAIRTNHLISQIRQHRPGEPASAGELLHAFVLGVLIGTTPKSHSYFSAMEQMWRNDELKRLRSLGQIPESSPSNGPFGTYIRGRRPL